MSSRRTHAPSSHLRLPWAIFGAVSVLALAASLVAAVPSGDRTTTVLALWGVVMVIAIAAALTYAIVSPFPDGASSSAGSAGPLGGFIDAGGSGGGFGDGGCG